MPGIIFVEESPIILNVCLKIHASNRTEVCQVVQGGRDTHNILKGQGGGYTLPTCSKVRVKMLDEEEKRGPS